jgi:hypothetical protein
MSSKKTSSEQRKERLAKALKSNIAKRKKGRAEQRKIAPDAPKTPPDDNGCRN